MARGIKNGSRKKISDRPVPKVEAAKQPNDGGILPELLTVQQVSHIINVPVSTLNKSRMVGPLREQTPLPRHVKIGKRVRYLRSEVFRWLSELETQQRAV